jgi:hypothetical protein
MKGFQYGMHCLHFSEADTNKDTDEVLIVLDGESAHWIRRGGPLIPMCRLLLTGFLKSHHALLFSDGSRNSK